VRNIVSKLALERKHSPFSDTTLDPDPMSENGETAPAAALIMRP
jgi:hypothetical protein